MASTVGLTPRDIKAAQLVTAATRELETGGPEWVRVRTVAASVGLTTQSIYSIFGGLPGLLNAVAERGLTDLATRVASVSASRDPVADLMTALIIHAGWAIEHPKLYRFMYTTTSYPTQDRPPSDTATTGTEGLSVHQTYLALISKAIAAGRLKHRDPVYSLRQLLSATHGWAMLQTGGDFGPDPTPDWPLLGDLLINLTTGLGDERTSARRSLKATPFL